MEISVIKTHPVPKSSQWAEKLEKIQQEVHSFIQMGHRRQVLCTVVCTYTLYSIDD
jgi:hypothetical protein